MFVYSYVRRYLLRNTLVCHVHAVQILYILLRRKHGIHEIVIRTLSGLCYLCHQLTCYVLRGQLHSAFWGASLMYDRPSDTDVTFFQVE
jgi:hypothetical protein